MAPLITLPIDLTRTAAALEGIHSELFRIGNALERLSPPVRPVENVRKATLADLHRTDHNTTQRIKDELAVFADEHGVILDSEAFVESIIKYECEVADAFGPQAIAELPWNKAAGKPIFQGHVDHSAGKESPKEEARATGHDA